MIFFMFSNLLVWLRRVWTWLRYSLYVYLSGARGAKGEPGGGSGSGRDGVPGRDGKDGLPGARVRVQARVEAVDH